MTTTDQSRLSAYLKRIGVTEPLPEGVAVLPILQQAQRRAIAFENLDVMLGRRIAIDSEGAFEKIVTRRRGGYCFEQNRVFSDILAMLGLINRPLLARVRLGLAPDYTPPRSHVLLLVEADGNQWIADAGFGGSHVPPLPFVDGAMAETDDGARHRLRHLGAPGELAGEWLLERVGPIEATDGRWAPHGDWQAQYSFDLAQVAPDDLEQASHWTSTRPATRFTTLHILNIVLPGGFAGMTDRELSIHGPAGTTRRTIDDAQDYRAVLADIFGLDLTAEEVAALPLFRDS